jgi:hypothetical protein
MLRSYTTAGAWNEFGCGGFRVNLRVLKVQNVESGVDEIADPVLKT